MSMSPRWPTATLASPGNFPRPAWRSGPGSYQITAFALGPNVHEILCASFKSKVCIYPSPLGLPNLRLAVLQSQMLQWLVFPVHDPWAGKPDVGLRTLTPVGEPLQYNFSPVCGLPPLGMWDLIILRVCPSYPSCCGSFFMSVVLEDLFW